MVDNPTFCQGTVLTTLPPVTAATTVAPINDDVFNTGILPFNSFIHLLPLKLNFLSQVLTTTGEKCVLPFKYKNTVYDSCISNDDTKYWCSLTPDYDAVPKKGYCSQGILIN